MVSRAHYVRVLVASLRIIYMNDTFFQTSSSNVKFIRSVLNSSEQGMLEATMGIYHRGYKAPIAMSNIMSIALSVTASYGSGLWPHSRCLSLFNENKNCHRARV